MNQEIINTLFNFLPETSLLAAILALNIITYFRKEGFSGGFYIYTGGIVLSLLFSLLQAETAVRLYFGGLIAADPLAYFGKVVISASLLIISLIFISKDKEPAEFSNILLFQLGAMIAVTSVNFLMLIISLEVMSIALLLLLGVYIKNIVKYYIYGAVSSGIMLFGFTLMYGITGSADYYGMNSLLSSAALNYNPLVVTLAVVMILAGLFFRMLTPPFNFAFPLFAKQMKTSHLALFLVPGIITVGLVTARFLLTVLQDTGSFTIGGEDFQFISGVNWLYMVSIAAGFAVVTGNLVILWQYDLKKIITFIAIAQAGYLLFGIAAASEEGLSAMLYSTITTGSVLLGLLYAASLIRKKFRFTRIDELKGIGRSDPFLFISFLLFILLAAGLPFTGGFAARVMLFEALASQGRIVLIGLSILSSVGAYYLVFRTSVLLFRNPVPINDCKTETFHKIILLVLLLPPILPGAGSEYFIEWIKFCSAIFKI